VGVSGSWGVFMGGNWAASGFHRLAAVGPRVGPYVCWRTLAAVAAAAAAAAKTTTMTRAPWTLPRQATGWGKGEF